MREDTLGARADGSAFGSRLTDAQSSGDLACAVFTAGLHTPSLRLRWRLPAGHLCPPVPSRINYLLWCAKDPPLSSCQRSRDCGDTIPWSTGGLSPRHPSTPRRVLCRLEDLLRLRPSPRADEQAPPPPLVLDIGTGASIEITARDRTEITSRIAPRSRLESHRDHISNRIEITSRIASNDLPSTAAASRLYRGNASRVCLRCRFFSTASQLRLGCTSRRLRHLPAAGQCAARLALHRVGDRRGHTRTRTRTHAHPLAHPLAHLSPTSRPPLALVPSACNPFLWPHAPQPSLA